MKKYLIVLLSFFSLLHAGERSSSAPYISGDSFRDYANFVLDETGKTFDPSMVKEGSTIFVKTDLLPRFFSEFHPKISAHYILITHNSDHPIPGPFASYLADEKIIAWFGQNLENFSNPKIHPIPIGFANKCWPHGNPKLIQKAQKQNAYERTIFMYMNFSPSTHPQRKDVHKQFKNAPFCKIEKPKDFYPYLLDLKKTKFVLSPRGNGLDCHRTWEALLMGAYPIVQTSSLDSMYTDLPVVIIKDWKEVTEEFLVQKEKEFSTQKFQIEKALLSYWTDQIEQTKNAFLKK
ncbi:MAG: hypothetical protein WCP39_03240 [Chlamydiota bacterium]